MRELVIGVVAALAVAVFATQSLATQSLAGASAAGPTAPPVADIVACTGVDLLSPAIQAVECSTDAVAGAVRWNPDRSVKLQAKPERDSPPVAAAAGWSSNGPFPVSGNEFCVMFKADPHVGPAGYAVIDLVLSWNGEQQPTVTLPLSHGTASYCVEDVPLDAENFFWEALAVTGASHGDAKVKVQFAGISFAAVP